MKQDDRERMGMRRLCREIFGTENAEELREIARKAAAYDAMTSDSRPTNERGAGRRRMFANEEVDCLIEMYHDGHSVSYLAERFHTSRQTIYKYLVSELRFERDPFLTMRMIYMHREQECTVIDVDFRHQKIYIRNKTDNLLFRAFGVIEEPTWEDFEEFLESRCFPVSRANLKLILRDIGVPSYDPLQIIEKTQGRMAEDHQWLRILYRDEVLRHGIHRLKQNSQD